MDRQAVASWLSWSRAKEGGPGPHGSHVPRGEINRLVEALLGGAGPAEGLDVAFGRAQAERRRARGATLDALAETVRAAHSAGDSQEMGWCDVCQANRPVRRGADGHWCLVCCDRDGGDVLSHVWSYVPAAPPKPHDPAVPAEGRFPSTPAEVMEKAEAERWRFEAAARLASSTAGAGIWCTACVVWHPIAFEFQGMRVAECPKVEPRQIVPIFVAQKS